MKQKPHKTVLMGVVCFSLLALFGCRREDVRTFSVAFSALTEADRAPAEAALSRYGGVRQETFSWDLQSKKLTFQYDSMMVAEENFRQALEAKGLKVIR